MDKPETIKEKLKAIKVLAEHGAPGERENAASMLTKLMAKYKLSEKDIADQQDTVDVFLQYKTKEEKNLAIQVIGFVKNISEVHFGISRNRVIANCTMVQAIEIQETYRHYLKAWRDQLPDFMKAFIRANNLVPDACMKPFSSFTEEEIKNIRKSEPLRKAITVTPRNHKKLMEGHTL